MLRTHLLLFQKIIRETSWWKAKIWEFRRISILTSVLTDVGKLCQGCFPVYENCFWPKSRRGSTASFSILGVCISLHFTSNGLMQQINLMYVLWEKNKFLFYCFLQVIEHDLLFQKYEEKFRVSLHCSINLEEWELILCPSLSRYLCIRSGNLNAAWLGKVSKSCGGIEVRSSAKLTMDLM